jgi:hypothetical protein
MLTVVCWRWEPPAGYRSQFGPAAVNVLRRMVARHYPRPHRFVCVTDAPAGLDPEVIALPPWNDFADVPSPSGGRNPSCYRRLRAFHPDIAETLGERFVSLDLDVVITGDLRPLWDRPEDFVIYGDTNPRTFYNGSMFLLSSGARPRVWAAFDPARSPGLSKAAGHHGSDQGWISYCLGPGEAKWTSKDGAYSYRNEIAQDQRQLPEDARIVFFHGHVDPWSPYAQMIPWVKTHWHDDMAVPA